MLINNPNRRYPGFFLLWRTPTWSLGWLFWISECYLVQTFFLHGNISFPESLCEWDILHRSTGGLSRLGGCLRLSTLGHVWFFDLLPLAFGKNKKGSPSRFQQWGPLRWVPQAPTQSLSFFNFLRCLMTSETTFISVAVWCLESGNLTIQLLSTGELPASKEEELRAGECKWVEHPSRVRTTLRPNACSQRHTSLWKIQSTR